MVDAIDVDAPIPYELTWAGQDAADSDELCACVVSVVGDVAKCLECGTVYYELSDLQKMIQYGSIE